MTALGRRAWLSLAVVIAGMAALIFVSAGTFRFWQAWLYLAVYGAAGAAITGYLIARDPALLARRMRGGPTAEKEPTQRLIMAIAAAAFVALQVVPGLDRRFGWSNAPPVAAFAGAGLIALGFFIVFLVFRQNAFTSSTIEVVAGQRVVSTGPYAIVRHPMYAGALIYLVGTPLALGSYWGLAPFALLLGVIIWRLRDEERVLERDLPGYSDYLRRVRYRLVPGAY